MPRPGAWERFGGTEDWQLAGADPQRPWWDLMVRGSHPESDGATECEQGGM